MFHLKHDAENRSLPVVIEDDKKGRARREEKRDKRESGTMNKDI